MSPGTWRRLDLALYRDEPATLVVRVCCWCGGMLSLELPRWPEDDCGECHSVYRLSLDADNTPNVRCTQIDPAQRVRLRDVLAEQGRLSDAS